MRAVVAPSNAPTTVPGRLVATGTGGGRYEDAPTGVRVVEDEPEVLLRRPAGLLCACLLVIRQRAATAARDCPLAVVGVEAEEAADSHPPRIRRLEHARDESGGGGGRGDAAAANNTFGRGSLDELREVPATDPAESLDRDGPG